MSSADEPRFHDEHADDNLGIPDDAGERASAMIERLIRKQAALRAENERLRAAISWIEPPFVDSKTSEVELRTRIQMCVEDKRRALKRKPE